MAYEARDGLDDDEGQVERYCYNIYSRELLYCMRVVVVMGVVVVVFLAAELRGAGLMGVVVVFVFHKVFLF